MIYIYIYTYLHVYISMNYFDIYFHVKRADLILQKRMLKILIIALRCYYDEIHFRA